MMIGGDELTESDVLDLRVYDDDFPTETELSEMVREDGGRKLGPFTPYEFWLDTLLNVGAI